MRNIVIGKTPEFDTNASAKKRAAENCLHRSRRQKINFGRSSGQCSLDQGHWTPLTITVASNPVDNQSSSRFSISLTWYKEPRLTLKFRVLGRGNGKHWSSIQLNLAGKIVGCGVINVNYGEVLNWRNVITIHSTIWSSFEDWWTKSREVPQGRKRSSFDNLVILVA